MASTSRAAPSGTEGVQREWQSGATYLFSRLGLMYAEQIMASQSPPSSPNPSRGERPRWPRWLRRHALASVFAVVLSLVGVHDGLETYREVATPQTVMIEGQRYTQGWVPQGTEKATRDVTPHPREKDADEYVDLIHMVEDAEQMEGVTSSAIESVQFVIHSCSSDLSPGVNIGLLEVKPNRRGTSTVINPSAVRAGAIAVCDDKSQWKINVSARGIWYAERSK
jgi:hypothetical protein